MTKFYPLLLCVSLSSCFAPALDYLGSSYTPTRDVDIYVDVSAIKKHYAVMGKSYVNIRGLFTLEKAQQAAVETAKQKGADAILFRDYFIQEGGSVQTTTKSDSVGASSVRIRTITSAPIETTRLDILFLKYE